MALSQDRVQRCRPRRYAFLSGLWSRSPSLLLLNAFLSGMWNKSLTFLLVVALVRFRPHLLVLQMRIFLGFFALFLMEKKCGVLAGQCGPAPARQFIHAGGTAGLGFVVGVTTPAQQAELEEAKASGPPGFHTTAREPKRAHLSAWRFKHHQNSTRRPPEREEKNEFCGGTGRKKREILGTPPFGPPPFGAHFFWVAPTLRTPTLRTHFLGPWPHPSPPTQNTQKKT